MNAKKILSVGILAAVGAAALAAAQTAPASSAGAATASAPSISITADDLVRAGFVSPKIQLPADNGDYPASASYFWAGASAKPNPTNNLVMVSAVVLPNGASSLFNYGTSQTPFDIVGGVGKEANLGGTRTAVSFIKNGIYVVVIGPFAKEVETLAQIASAKI